MKNLILVLSVLVLIFGGLTIGYCYDNEADGEYTFNSPPVEIDRDEIPYGNSAINKLERGVINMATFWMEIPAEVAKVSKEQDPAAGVTVGVVNGVITSAIRGVTAIYDTATFPVPSYTKPAMKPEYAWKAADDKIKAWLW
ncbi:MAG: exosortase system-associated protein, TIGR04073 family [Candidatus Omnitrophica bacterium]|jgi:putative exosortase-associated protein (TIGR04073 family)|nr:exosortase system-associated protein, TIGR04073 family [Candidatus Omnitrophota bacterium]MDD5690714.1 exosortase system-associated protein, TIGR04073 family [Candidatus Omnitrophota bacterium]